MIVVPMDDGRRHSGKMTDVGTITVRVKSMSSGSLHDTAGVTSITRYTTVCTQLFQRKPLAIICQDHGQTGGTTLHCFHLYHHRYFLYASFFASHDLGRSCLILEKHFVDGFTLCDDLHVAKRHLSQCNLATLFP